MTNKDKFVKVFGFEPDVTLKCEIVTKEVCKQNGDCLKCPYDNWWKREYQKPVTPETLEHKADRKAWVN